MQHAARAVPFYRDRFDEALALPLRRFTIETIRQLPVLHRGEVQAAGDRISTGYVPEGHGRVQHVATSGSTGQPLRIRTTDLSSWFFMAQGLRYHQWHRRDFRRTSMTITSLKPEITVQKTKGWVSGFPTGAGYRVNFSLPAPKIFEALLEANPHYLQVHPSTLAELLRLSRREGRKPGNLVEVRSVSEALSPALRQTLMDTWGVPATDNYSAQELNILALQCPQNPEHLHVQSESALLEVLDRDGNPCRPGQTGRCVVTQLVNFATPLVRYEYGDYAEVGEPCACGRGLPTLKSVLGRERNLLVLENGDRLSPRLALEDIVTELPVIQYQLVQKTHRDIEIRLATQSPLTELQEQSVIGKCRDDIGQPLDYRIVYVDEIPKLASGKFEAFRCEVDTSEVG